MAVKKQDNRESRNRPKHGPLIFEQMSKGNSMEKGLPFQQNGSGTIRYTMVKQIDAENFNKFKMYHRPKEKTKIL